MRIAQWKRQLIEASAGIFAGGRAIRRALEHEHPIEQPYQGIGQLKVEVDWLRK